MDSFVIFEDAPSDGVWKAMIIKAIIFVVLGIFCLAFPFAALNLSAYLLAFFLIHHQIHIKHLITTNKKRSGLLISILIRCL